MLKALSVLRILYYANLLITKAHKSFMIKPKILAQKINSHNFLGDLDFCRNPVPKFGIRALNIPKNHIELFLTPRCPASIRLFHKKYIAKKYIDSKHKNFLLQNHRKWYSTLVTSMEHLEILLWQRAPIFNWVLITSL